MPEYYYLILRSRWTICLLATQYISSLETHKYTQTCHSSRFNRDIPIFQHKSRSIPISRLYVWKSRVFVSFRDWKKKGVSFCCMARVSKPTKFGLKINAMIGWILCTPRLSEWSRLGLASLSGRPELGLTWCHSYADLRNSAGFEGSSHLSSIPPVFPPFAKIWAAETGKVRSPKL